MTLAQITILAVLAAALGRLRSGRALGLLAASSTVLFWLQAAEPIAPLTFWLPVGTLALTCLCWGIVASPGSRTLRKNWPAISTMLGVILVLGLSPQVAHEFNPGLAPPTFRWGLVMVVTFLSASALLWRWRPPLAGAAIVASLGILLVFVITKSPYLLGTGLRALASLPVGADIVPEIPFAWLGYSYVAFRLLHTLRDHATGRLPDLNLSEYTNYVIFFPAFSAGPIDRAERFVADLRSPLVLTKADWVEVGSRLVMGLFKKLVLADLLAVIALNDLLVQYVTRPAWMWVFLYAYALRIFLDFSGYTDVAIALGRLLGVRLPENFAAPYLKPNIALFWNSWHISLTQWFRAYIFNPLARTLRRAPSQLPEWLVVLLTQLATMLMIGLWHGITWSFALWGLWHGIGLFIHNRWQAYLRSRWPDLTLSRTMARVTGALGIFLTFHFVALGWLFFGLSTPELTLRALRLLFLGAA